MKKILEAIRCINSKKSPDLSEDSEVLISSLHIFLDDILSFYKDKKEISKQKKEYTKNFLVECLKSILLLFKQLCIWQGVLVVSKQARLFLLKKKSNQKLKFKTTSIEALKSNLKKTIEEEKEKLIGVYNKLKAVYEELEKEMGPSNRVADIKSLVNAQPSCCIKGKKITDKNKEGTNSLTVQNGDKALMFWIESYLKLPSTKNKKSMTFTINFEQLQKIAEYIRNL
jgi:hypothetical protein